MKRKRKPPKEQYDFVYIRVEEHSVRIGASINYEARDRRILDDQIRVYRFDSCLDLFGICTYPEDRTGSKFNITIYGREDGEGSLDIKLADCHERNDNGVLKYRKYHDRHIPIYKVPNGLGLFEKQRGTTNWNGWLWVPTTTVTQMLTLLTTTKPLYIDIHERKFNRNRWINGLSLQTCDPMEE